MQLAYELLPVGRLSRRDFWWRHLLVLPLLLWSIVAAEQGAGRPWDLVPVVLTLLFLVSVWGRRLHDRGRSAWWLCAVALPVLGAMLLFVECGLRGTREAVDARHLPRTDYKTV